MDVQKYISDGASVNTLATADQTEVGRTILHALGVEIRRRNRMSRKNPRVNTENIRDDIRHKLGEIDGLEWLGRLVTAARDTVSGKPAKEDET